MPANVKDLTHGTEQRFTLYWVLAAQRSQTSHMEQVNVRTKNHLFICSGYRVIEFFLTTKHSVENRRLTAF